jgi:hypothetical protein
MAMAQRLRGAELLLAWGVERFPFLKEPQKHQVGEEPVRFMQAEFASPQYPKWAPRDVLEPSATYAEFESRGYHEMELPLSLVGHGGTRKKPAPAAVRSNRFTRPQYSYMHLPFGRLTQFLEKLHHEDRFLAFLLYEGAHKTHIYADLDADASVFPRITEREDEHVAEFVFQMATFFQLTFGRAMDLRGLLLLQASNEKKVSWHMHCQTEAFTEVKQLKAFMQAFRQYVEKQHEASQVKLCALHEGRYVHVCDLAPFSSNQNFRAPWNQKPGKNPLLPRSFVWAEDNRLVFTAARADPRTIDPEVLFRAHPNLALPTRKGYQFLEMPADRVHSQLALKRKATCSGDNGRPKSSRKQGTHTQARLSVLLTGAETAQVQHIVAPDLGAGVVFDALCRDVDVATGLPCIRGECHRQTAHCPHRSKASAAKYTHHSNRMRIQIEDGAKCYSCYASGCKPVYVAWKMTEADKRLINPASRDMPIGATKETRRAPTAACAASASSARTK